MLSTCNANTQRLQTCVDVFPPRSRGRADPCRMRESLVLRLAVQSVSVHAVCNASRSHSDVAAPAMCDSSALGSLQRGLAGLGGSQMKRGLANETLRSTKHIVCKTSATMPSPVVACRAQLSKSKITTFHPLPAAHAVLTRSRPRAGCAVSSFARACSAKRVLWVLPSYQAERYSVCHAFICLVMH
jgi:hypothetical protein